MKPSSFTYYETGSTDPYYNLAFEEYILTHCREGDSLILWQNDNTIVVGMNQNTEAEINRAFAEEHNIRVVRRTTGGGAVYHDLGNLNYSFITDTEGSDAAAKKRFTEPILAALRALGLPAVASGRNDILIDGRKVSGTAQRIDRGRILHHGTLLFDADPSAIEGALNVDPEKIKAKGIRSVRSRVGNIRPLLSSDLTIEQFREHILRELAGADVRRGQLSGDALAGVLALRDGKYATWEWNYGRSPAADMHLKKRFPGGSLELYLTLTHGTVSALRIFGDFMARQSLAPLTDALIGTACRREDIAAVLDRFPLNECLGGITKEEFLSVLFS